MANANIEKIISTKAHGLNGRTVNPYALNAKEIAPITQAIPIPIEKNSKRRSANPEISKRYVTGGLATVCISWSIKLRRLILVLVKGDSLGPLSVSTISEKKLPRVTKKSPKVGFAHLATVLSHLILFRVRL